MLHSIRAELLRRLGRDQEAAAAYEAAIALTTNMTERAFLEDALKTVARL
jgi:RNA polymerase sigma-70 factor, ECF subfamily